MRRWQLSKRDRRRFAESIRSFGFQLNPDSKVEVVVEEGIEMLVIDGLASFIKLGDTYIPHLKLLLKKPDAVKLPRIVVDEGAVMPIARGADLMRPGIVSVEGEFEKDSIVVVVEPSRGLPLAVHRTLYSSGEILSMEKGRVTKRLHHLGDRFWKLAERLGLG